MLERPNGDLLNLSRISRITSAARNNNIKPSPVEPPRDIATSCGVESTVQYISFVDVYGHFLNLPTDDHTCKHRIRERAKWVKNNKILK